MVSNSLFRWFLFPWLKEYAISKGGGKAILAWVIFSRTKTQTTLELDLAENYN
jgi:hypothetical protein